MRYSVLRLSLSAVLATRALAHTWIEQMVVISNNGLYQGDYGYPRGFVARTDPGFDGFSDDYLLPTAASGRLRINGSDLLCHPAQRTQNQSNEKYPRLQVAPGDWFAMKYAENGHVTLPANQKGKPLHGGTVFVFGTTEPKDDEKITDVMDWTADGSGGDKRGKLLAAQNFDDGRCYQINPSNNSTMRQVQFAKDYPDDLYSKDEQWCESDVQLPTDAPTGKIYTLYWVWQWPTAVGTVDIEMGKDEYYTTCADVDVVASPGKEKAVHTVAQPNDGQTAAVSTFKSRAALTTNPTALSSAGWLCQCTPGSPSSPTAAAPHAHATSSLVAASSSPASSATLSASPAANSNSVLSNIPTLRSRPGGAAHSAATGNADQDEGFVTITVTAVFTVTAPSPAGMATVTQSTTAHAKRHLSKGAKFHYLS